MEIKTELKGKLKHFMYWPVLLTLLLLVMNVPAYIIDVKIGGLFSVFVVFYFIIMLLVYKYSKPHIIKELIEFGTEYENIQKQILEEMEVPYALLDYEGRILWINKKFSQVTGKEKDYHKSITSIFSAVTKEIIQKKEPVTELKISWQDKRYHVHMDRIHLAGEENSAIGSFVEQYMTALYLFDETELERCMIENREQKMICGLVYIDNYEEALESIEEVKRSLLVALVDRKVNKYFSEQDAIVKKLEKDKYFVAFKQKFLDNMVQDKFSLIEDVKTIKVGNEMAVTLSIGVGIGGNTYNQNYEYSRMAIDLALGRGGDQAVIKEGENITYFGGKTRQVEKMTRVKARVKAHALREIIESKEQILIMGHRISDVDSFGAAIGVYCAARVLGKKAQIVINEVTSSLRPLKEQFTEEKGYPREMFIDSEEAMEIVDQNSVVMVVDTNRPGLTECPELLTKTKAIVVFDHHRQSSDVIEHAVLSYIETYASSTCEMIAEVLQYFSEKIHLSPQEADCIYAGILIDTDNFNTKTGVRTFEAAAYLRRCGAEVTRVRKMLRDNIDAYKARAEIVRRAKVYQGSFAISIYSGDGVESPTIVGARAANELLNIVGIKASFVLTEYHGQIYISSRSIDEINVQLVMEKMGGGGHLSVAGAQLSDCTMEEAVVLLERTLETMLKEGEIEL